MTTVELEAVGRNLVVLDHVAWELEMLLLRTVPSGGRTIRALHQARTIADDLEDLSFAQSGPTAGPFRTTAVEGIIAALRRSADALERTGGTPLPEIERNSR